MSKTTKLLLIIAAVLLVIALGVTVALVALSGDNTPGQQSGEAATYTIEVKSASGILLKDVGLYIYEDSSKEELVTFIKTNESGVTSFTDVARDTYIAVLDKIPTGYEAEEYYPLTGERTEIVLQTGKMDASDVENLTYKLGDAVLDFAVTGPDGTEYTLSGLFKGKKAVVLNFFYNNCQPCMLEFPFLQEAYAEYSDSIAVLAMNPVDGDDASVAALQKEMGITFPMVKCGEEWAKIMQLTAYPTTVIIDRFGNICLMHTGSVPDAKTFKDAFAYFASEEYEQKLIDSIEDLKTEEPEGTKENPSEVGGQNSFEATVEPGQEVYFDLYKVNKMYLQIESEFAYVVYNGETYKPKNGVVSLMVSAPDTFTPAKIAIGNTGKEKLTFKVYLGALRGSFDNPYAMELGEVDVKVSAGNEQGVYYTFTAKEDGMLTLQCMSVTSGVKYSYYLFNTVSSAMRNLESDSQTGANGEVTVSVSAKKDQLVQICISTLPDGSNNYPAANFKFKVTFTAGEVTDQNVVVLTDFTVTVTDDENQPVPNVSMNVVAKNPTPEQAKQPTSFSTDKEGVARISLLPGTYEGTVIVPDGYTAENTAFTLTETAVNATVKLTKIKKADYTVQVTAPDGTPVENVFVKLGAGSWLRTDSEGKVTENLDIGAYTVTIMIPAGYSGETAYAFDEGKTELTITLGHPAGSQENPYVVTEYPFTTEKLSGGEERYYSITPIEGMVGVAIRNADAYIRCGEITYGADAKGVVTYSLDAADTQPVVLVVGNGGNDRESYTLEAIHAPGSELNPLIVDAYPYTTPAIAAGGSVYVQFSKVDKVTGFTAADADVSVFYGETEYLPEAGVLTYSFIEANEVLKVKNNGTAEKTFTFAAVLPPVGTEENPYVVTGAGNLPQLKLAEEDADGYYYTYTSTASGTLTVRLLQAVSTPHEIELYTNNRYACMSIDGANRRVSIDMEAGQSVVLHAYAVADATTGAIPAVNMRLSIAFAAGEIEPLPTDPDDTEPSVPESSVPDASEPEDSEPSQPTDEYAYTVTVTDIFGAGQKGVDVMFMKDGAPVAVVSTNKNGVATMYTSVKETYTVELAFSGKDYYYDKAAAVVSADMPELTIKLTANMDVNDYEPLYILNGNPAYNLYVGGTRVKLGMGKPNFSAEYENNCYFLFTPQTAGTYQITVSPNVEISLWGTTSFVSKQLDSVTDNTITFSISSGSVPYTTYVIGVKADTDVVDAVLNIARIGDPEFSIADQPWTEWETGSKPKDTWMTEVGLKAMAGNAYYDLAKAPVYMDINAASGAYNLVYDEAGGYYRLGQNGPIVLVNLNAAGRFVPLYERVNGNGQYGGSSVTSYFFDATGKFLSKEDYTAYLQNVFAEVNLDAISEKGYYPLTKDMMRVLQNGFKQWWDPTSPNYMEGFATANPEYAWLFACCYVQK